MKKVITIKEWQALDKQTQKKYIRDCWNPKKYILK